MLKNTLYLIIFLLIFNLSAMAQEDDYLTINTSINPKRIKQGNEGVLKIKITPKAGIKISSHPELMIKLDNNNNLTFSKIFFTASELDFQTKQENHTVFLDLEKEISIPFKVKETSLTGNHKINGEIVFTAVFKDNWSLKTYQKFNAAFISRRNTKLKKR